MKPGEHISCTTFPCLDVDNSKYIIPQAEIIPETIQMIMVSEAAPHEHTDYYYSGKESLFSQTTVQAFKDAGIQVESINDLVERGVYFTTAIKCGKQGYTVKAATIKNCSHRLEGELALFPNVKVIMLMGDFAIKAVNYIAKRRLGERVIPVGSTYKIRGDEYYYGEIRVFPSYLQAGPAFFIERSKRRMIKEDIIQAVKLLGWTL
ncbi:uracil-DNA glycosylase [Candidatus Bathyarchaeota archaeon]|nr:uracil-DNA glycosylase [Candidatus Bathyarchaeota archaeon]